MYFLFSGSLLLKYLFKQYRNLDFISLIFNIVKGYESVTCQVSLI